MRPGQPGPDYILPHEALEASRIEKPADYRALWSKISNKVEEGQLSGIEGKTRTLLIETEVDSSFTEAQLKELARNLQQTPGFLTSIDKIVIAREKILYEIIGDKVYKILADGTMVIL